MATLHRQQAAWSAEEKKISSTDRRIRAYIERYGNIIYDAEIVGEKDWQIFYHLSELRTGILSWYDFAPDAEILEIGAGFGALTGRLCKSCGHVTATERSLYRAEALAKRYENVDNLDIFACDLSELESEEHYDYIVLIGLLERVGGGSASPTPYVTYLKRLKELLKPGGKILFAVENRYGLRYFCGVPEPHTNRAFDGINGYRRGTGGYSFDRRQLETIMREAGLSAWKFYYPLPDYSLPQLIYTDECLPEKNLKERLIPYYRRNDTLVASEMALYDDVIANGVFPFFANSFLVECGLQCRQGEVIYGAVSTDRGEERSYATVIRQGGTVQKQPLYESGRRNAVKLYEAIEDLKKHGIPVVEHALLADGSLELPYIPWSTLSNHIRTIMSKQPERVLEILDCLYEYILKASECVPAEKNALLARESEEAAGTGNGEDSVRAELSRKDFGPILAKAYIELIPLNCFFNPESGEYLFFDQEFVRENYPAKYVLFRAIHYIYCFTPGAEQSYPQEKVIQRYGMEDTWALYLHEEERFLDEVRNRRQYDWFYRRTKTDEKRMLENAERLTSEEELIAEYPVSDKMKQIWRVELEILDEIDRICRKHDLRYFLVHGSLLGAVRHGGFIPWDDDLDIAMLREDYDRFVEAAEKELADPFSIHTPATERDMFWGGYARVRNGRTTAIETRELGHKGNLGIWVDVLPLDVCTTDEKRFAKKERHIRNCHRLLLAKIYGADYQTYADMGKLRWLRYRLQAMPHSHAALCRRLEKAQRMYTEEKSELLAFFTGYEKHRKLSAESFADTVFLEFAGRKVPAPKGYENYLLATMGKDYMKYPPKEERKPKHRGVYDPEIPYTQYTELLCDTFADAGGKQIILFGAGMMFEEYMKKYGDRYRPAFLVDNDETKWEKRRMGIEIRKPEAILEIPEKKRHLIICSYYYREISRQLEQMGVSDYKVYVQEPEWIVQTEEKRG